MGEKLHISKKKIIVVSFGVERFLVRIENANSFSYLTLHSTLVFFIKLLILTTLFFMDYFFVFKFTSINFLIPIHNTHHSILID